MIAAFLISSILASMPLQAQNVPIGNSQHIFCSSVKIGSLRLLTARHCLRDNGLVAYCDNNRIPLTVQAQDHNADLALVIMGAPCASAITTPLGTHDPVPGSEVFVIGCPMGYCGMITRGVVSNHVMIEGQQVVITDTKTYFGNSGGGLFDGTTLVGIASNLIVFNHAKVPTSYGVFVPLTIIQQFLKGVLPNACPNF